jgi:hypothetical protein
MGKTKEMLNDFQLSQEEIDNELYVRGDEDFQYEQWKNSPEYVDFVNSQIALATPKYSQVDVDNAVSIAFKSLVVTSEEVGIDVYEKLFRQHLYENLPK